MKLYHLNLGWEGSLTVIATSREEAISILRDSTEMGKFVEPEQWDGLLEYEIKPGLVIEQDTSN